jgi:iron complex outermembrane recepter protein
MAIPRTLALLPFLCAAPLSLAQSAAPQDPPPRALPKVSVEADEPDPGTIPAGNSASSKTDIPLAEIPQAISVVTLQSIREQGSTDLASALRGVAGVSRSSTYGYYDAYTIRGYDAAYGSVFLDGLTTASAAGTNNELLGLEQVEVVKGPASALFGASPLGGIVNLVSKRPLAGTFLETSFTTGSYDRIEASIDGNAPLNDSGSLLARVNLLYRDADDFVDFSGENRLYVAPALTWRIGEYTRLTFLGRYQRDHDNPWSPLIAYGTVLPSAYGELPISFSVNRDNPSRSVQNQDRRQIGYLLDSEITDKLSFSQTVRYTRTKTFWNDWVFSDAILDESFVDGIQQGHIWGLNVYGPFRQVDNELGADSRLKLSLDGGGIRHSALAGIDFKRYGQRHAEDGGNYDMEANTLDILAPDYSAPLIHDPFWAYSNTSNTKQIGYYLQDHVSIGEKLFITAGGRWDDVETDGQEDDAFSPNVGINYFIAAGVSLYANWSKSFTPQFGWITDVDGNALPPERGRNIEGGVKLGDPTSGFNALVAIFNLTRQNVAVTDPENPFFHILTGEQRSRGVEIEGAWTPSSALKLSVAYTYLDSQITKDTTFTPGTRLANVPRNNFYAFGKYTVQEGSLRNLGLTLALLYNSDKNSSLAEADINGDGTPEPAVPLPGYTVVDVGASYLLGAWEARLALNNALDERYYPDAGYFTRITPGEPRNWRLSVSKRF